MGMKNESVMVFGVGPGLGASAQGDTRCPFRHRWRDRPRF